MLAYALKGGCRLLSFRKTDTGSAQKFTYVFPERLRSDRASENVHLPWGVNVQYTPLSYSTCFCCAHMSDRRVRNNVAFVLLIFEYFSG